MSTTCTDDTYIRVRVDTATKKNAAMVLTSMGLSLPEVIRMLISKVADEQRLPFEIKTPNAETQQAMAELEAGEGHKSYSVAEFMAELNADD